MIKIPLARAKAATASFPTLLDDGSVFLRIRRTHATGGSNSTADGGPDFVAAVDAVGVSLLVTALEGAGLLGSVSLATEEDSAFSPVSILLSPSGFLGAVSVAAELILCFSGDSLVQRFAIDLLLRSSCERIERRWLVDDEQKPKVDEVSITTGSIFNRWFSAPTSHSFIVKAMLKVWKGVLTSTRVFALSRTVFSRVQKRTSRRTIYIGIFIYW